MLLFLGGLHVHLKMNETAEHFTPALTAGRHCSDIWCHFVGRRGPLGGTPLNDFPQSSHKQPGLYAT